MSIVDDFHRAFAPELIWSGPERLPTALAVAVAQVLPVAAAGIELVDGAHRTPLGASSSDAAAAERWQFTVGDDPCAAAVDRGEPVVAPEVVLRRHWLAVHTVLRRHTPFRSVVALPLGRGGSTLGALALHFEADAPGPGFDLDAARVLAALVHRELLEAIPLPDLRRTDPPGRGHPLRGNAHDHVEPPRPPAWMDGPAALGRQEVWVAVGRCIGALGLDTRESLVLLRQHARARDVTLDEVAHDVVTGRVPVQALPVG